MNTIGNDMNKTNLKVHSILEKVSKKPLQPQASSSSAIVPAGDSRAASRV